MGDVAELHSNDVTMVPGAERDDVANPTLQSRTRHVDGADQQNERQEASGVDKTGR